MKVEAVITADNHENEHGKTERRQIGEADAGQQIPGSDQTSQDNRE